MRGFHIDMNVGQFTGEYLKAWLVKLAGLGYDTIIWELENAVAWETCPQCAAPGALSKDDFRELISLCDELGMESIPLLQTLAHCEYVLRHDAYSHLAEIPGEVDQYCPRNPSLVPFLQRWIDEYVDLFGQVRRFHLGADESWWLASCDKCKAFVADNGLSKLFIDHINALAGPLIERGITPIIWADMVLHHHQALDTLSREVMLFDWLYDRTRHDERTRIWGKGLRSAEDLEPDDLATFGQWLFPHGDEPGRPIDPFYTAHFLADKGFEVVVCPASASAGDSVFVPRSYFHLINTYDSFGVGQAAHLSGALLTSWTVRLNPWQAQEPTIALSRYMKDDPGASLEQCQSRFMLDRFGSDDNRFWRACGLLSRSCLFADSGTLGFHKNVVPRPIGHVATTVQQLVSDGRVEAELSRTVSILDQYERGLAIMTKFAADAPDGGDLTDVWILGGRNLVNRALAAGCLLEHAEDVIAGGSLSGANKDRAQDVLTQLRDLRAETETYLAPSLQPARLAIILDWMYESVDHALAQLAGL